MQNQPGQACIRPSRDCLHPGTPHAHGSRVAYVKDRCRCPACTAANTAASAARKRAQAFGRWAPYVDAAPVCEHIHRLRRDGLGYQRIASLAQTSSSHIRELAGTAPRSASRPSIRRVRSDTAERILAIRVTPVTRAPHSRVDALGSRRRLQALIAAGWPPPTLAARLGRSAADLTRIMAAERVTAARALQVGDLYDRLSNATPPQRTAEQRSAAAAARALAREHGWPPPMAWDDIDTDPAAVSPPPDPAGVDEIAVERAVAGDGIRFQDLNPGEQTEVVRRLTERGWSIHQIAEQLHTAQRTVSRRRASLAGSDAARR